MDFRVRAFVALAIACLAVPGAGLARPYMAPTPGHSPKLLIYVAKGGADACGPGCSRWIAVEGTVDGDAAARVRQFLRGVKDTSLPFYLYSPGGDVRQAFAIGRMLRTRKATARVGQTIAAQCPGAQGDEACYKVKAAGGDIEARIVTRNAMCNSACGYLILGATVREVALDAAIVVHNTKLFGEFIGRPTAAQRAQAMSRATDRSDRERVAFVSSMGVALELVDLIKTVKFESMHILTRPELYRFRVDPRPVVETAWISEPEWRTVIRKQATIRQGDGRTFRKVEWRLSCYGKDRARLMFLREAEKDDAVTPAVTVTPGSGAVTVLDRSPAGRSAYEVWTAVVTAGDVAALFAGPRLQVTETAAVQEGPPAQSVFDIETAGLEPAWTKLSATCTAAPGVVARPAALPSAADLPRVAPSPEAYATPGPGWGVFVPKSK